MTDRQVRVYHDGYPVVDDTPDTTVCMSFDIPDSVAWRRLFLSVLSTATVWVNYRRTGDARGRETAARFKNIVETSRECDMAQYRLGSDGCVLQQSLDSGTTWDDVIDIGACIRKNSRLVEEKIINDIIDGLRDLYDPSQPGDGIAPEMVYTGGDGDYDRDGLICVGCQLVVELACELELARRNELSKDLNTVVDTVADALTGIAVFIPYGPLVALGAQVIGGIIKEGVEIWESVSELVLNDKSARHDVACCMFDGLKGDTPTQSRFHESLNACSLSGAPELLRGAIAPLLTYELDLYLSFLNTLSALSDYAGWFDACPCGTWAWEADLTLGDGGFVTAGDDGWIGTWVSGSGWLPDSDGDLLQLYVVLRYSRSNIVAVEVDLDFDRDDSETSDISAYNYHLLDGDTSRFVHDVSYDAIPASNQQIRNTHTVDIMSDALRFSVRPRISGQNPASAALLRVRLVGKGIKPPELGGG